MLSRSLRDLFIGLRHGLGYTFSERRNLTAAALGLPTTDRK